VLILLLLEYNNVIVEFELHHYTEYYAHHLRKLQICDEDARNLTNLERILNVFVGHLKCGNLTITMDCPRAREFPPRVFSFERFSFL
jgi:hypothetical protein